MIRSSPSITAGCVSKCASSITRTGETAKPGMLSSSERTTSFPGFAVTADANSSSPVHVRSAEHSRSQNRRGAASAAVRLIQPTGAFWVRAQSASRTVFPDPGPAASNMSGSPAAPSSTASRRGRATCRGGRGGTPSRPSTCSGVIGRPSRTGWTQSPRRLVPVWPT